MKRKSLIAAIITVTALVLAACGSSSSSYEKATAAESAAYYDEDFAAAEEAYDMSDDIYEYEEPMEEMNAAGTEAGGGDVPTDQEIQSSSNRKLIRTVNLSAETREFDKLVANVSDRINALGGYAESTDIHGNSYDAKGERTAFIVARIPAMRLDSFVQSVTEESNITSKSESAEDVTLQYADVEAHRDSLKIEQARLNELLEQAETLENIIELENRLTQVRYEIESYESRLRTMNNQVVYSTVNLSIREVREYTPEPVVEPTFGERISSGFIESCGAAWEMIQDFIVGFVSILPTLIVLLLILGIIFLIIFAVIKGIIAIAKKSGKFKQISRKPKIGKGKQIYASVVSSPPAGTADDTAAAIDAGAASAAEGDKENK